MQKLISRQTIFFLLLLSPALCLGQAVKKYEKLSDRIVVTLNKGEIHVIPLTENSVRIQYGLEVKTQLPELVFVEKADTPDFKISESGKSLEISTSRVTVVVYKQSGALSFRNDKGMEFLSEKHVVRVFKESSVQGEPCYIAGQSFHSPPDEYLFGTGQFQDGYLNIKGLPRRLTQVNSQISVPFIMSSKGYGLLWYNYGLTDFNPADNILELKPAESSAEVTTVLVTTTEGTKTETRREGIFKGVLEIKEKGQYAMSLCLFPFSEAIPSEPAKPNILMILVDDHGYGDLSITGGKDIQTPHLDKLFQKGVQFTNFYSNSIAEIRKVLKEHLAGIESVENQLEK